MHFYFFSFRQTYCGNLWLDPDPLVAARMWKTRHLHFSGPLFLHLYLHVPYVMHIWQISSFFLSCSHTTTHTKTHTLSQPLPSSRSLVRFSSLPHTHTHTRPSLSGREEGNCWDGKRKKAPTLAPKAPAPSYVLVCMYTAAELHWSLVLQPGRVVLK